MATKKAAYKITIGEFEIGLEEPSRHVLKVAYSKLMKVSGELNLIEAGEIILESCQVSGGKGIKEDDSAYISACLKAAELIEVKEAKLEKL